MTTYLMSMFNGLLPEGILHGDNSPESAKSFTSKVRAIKKQSTKQYRKLILKKGGTDVIIVLPSPYTPPNILITHAKMIKIKELLTSLEEDGIRLINGSTDETVIANYRLTSAAFENSLQDLLYSLGLSKTPPKS